MKGITHGACDYLLKHVRIEELKNIWQHVVRKKRIDSKDQDHLDHGDANDKFNHGIEENMGLVPMMEQIIVGSLTGRGKNKMNMMMMTTRMLSCPHSNHVEFLAIFLH